MNELMPHLKSKKRELIHGAVPTIFLYKVYEEINMDSTNIFKKLSASRSIELERSSVSK
jgi:hypothetical protein